MGLMDAATVLDVDHVGFVRRLLGKVDGAVEAKEAGDIGLRWEEMAVEMRISGGVARAIDVWLGGAGSEESEGSAWPLLNSGNELEELLFLWAISDEAGGEEKGKDG